MASPARAAFDEPIPQSNGAINLEQLRFSFSILRRRLCRALRRFWPGRFFSWLRVVYRRLLRQRARCQDSCARVVEEIVCAMVAAQTPRERSQEARALAPDIDGPLFISGSTTQGPLVHDNGPRLAWFQRSLGEEMCTHRRRTSCGGWRPTCERAAFPEESRKGCAGIGEFTIVRARRPRYRTRFA